MRCRQTKLIYAHHPPPPWLIEDAPRDRSSRLLGSYRAHCQLTQIAQHTIAHGNQEEDHCSKRATSEPTSAKEVIRQRKYSRANNRGGRQKRAFVSAAVRIESIPCKAYVQGHKTYRYAAWSKHLPWVHKHSGCAVGETKRQGRYGRSAVSISALPPSAVGRSEPVAIGAVAHRRVTAPRRQLRPAAIEHHLSPRGVAVKALFAATPRNRRAGADRQSLEFPNDPN